MHSPSKSGGMAGLALQVLGGLGKGVVGMAGLLGADGTGSVIFSAKWA